MSTSSNKVGGCLYPIGKTFGFEGIPSELKVKGWTSSDNPYIPSVDASYVFRRDFLREFTAFLNDPSGDGFFITGPTGSGKTSGVEQVLAKLYWPLQAITANGRLEFSDLVGQFKLSKTEKDQPPEMKWVYGPLPRAMKFGHVLLINEVDYMDPAEISGLNDVLEGRPLVIAENEGEVIKPHPMFRIVVSANSNGRGDESGLHAGVQQQNIAFMDRFRMSRVGYLDEETERTLVKNKVPDLPERLIERLVSVANAVRKQFLGESGTGADGQLATTMSTRTVVRWAKLAVCFSKAPNALAYSLNQALLHKAEASDATAIAKIAQSILGDQWSTE